MPHAAAARTATGTTIATHLLVPPHDPASYKRISLSKDSPHINRRLRATTTHNLSKSTQLRWPRTHSWRSSQRCTSSCRARKPSRSSSASRAIGQSESPLCSVPYPGLLSILEAWCLARRGAVGLLRLLGAVGWHVHGSHSRDVS